MVGTMRSAYTAVVEPDQGWWAIRVTELPGVFSQAKRLDRVEAMARDAISMLLDVPPDSFDVTVRERLTPEAERVVADARRARTEAAERQEFASAKSREAVHTLTRLGLPQRDIGRLLDLSHQRVGQLGRSATGNAPDRRAAHGATNLRSHVTPVLVPATDRGTSPGSGARRPTGRSPRGTPTGRGRPSC